MKRLLRIILDAATALSLILCVVLAGAWPVSLSHPNSWSQYAQAGRYSLANKGGIVSFQWHHGLNIADWPVDPQASPREVIEAAGVILDPSVGVFVPFHHLFCVFASLPLIRLLAGVGGMTRKPRTGRASPAATTPNEPAIPA